MTERACCDDIVDVSARVDTLERDSKEFKAFMQEMRDAMTYRLPLWATFAMTTMGGVIGWLIASQ